MAFDDDEQIFDLSKMGRDGASVTDAPVRTSRLGRWKKFAHWNFIIQGRDMTLSELEIVACTARRWDTYDPDSMSGHIRFGPFVIAFRLTTDYGRSRAIKPQYRTAFLNLRDARERYMANMMAMPSSQWRSREWLDNAESVARLTRAIADLAG